MFRGKLEHWHFLRLLLYFTSHHKIVLTFNAKFGCMQNIENKLLQFRPELKTQAKETIECKKLDNFIDEFSNLKKPILLKIDTQGYEKEVLGSGENILDNFTGISCEISVQPLYKGEAKFLEIDLNLSEQVLELLPVDVPEIKISGSAPAKIFLKFQESNKVEFELTSDLKGVELSYLPIGWIKDINSEADLNVSGALGDGFVLDDISLNSSELVVVGSALRNKDESFVLNFEKLALRDVFDLQLVIKKDGSLDIIGGQLNMQEFLKLPLVKKSSKKSSPITIYLDELKLYEKQIIKRFTAALETSGKGNFSGSLNDLASFNGNIDRIDAGYSIVANSNNAGSFIRALGAARAADGGSAQLNLRQLKDTPGLKGNLKIKNIRLRNMPALLELLDAISIVGLIDQLQGPGLVLNEIEADFINLPDQIKFEQASAFGPSIGISLEGYYAKATNNLNMQGVLSPLYVVNAIGSIFTRKGEGLLGFNYRLKGNADRPEVLVNPLSIFSPAIFREIFRRPVPNLE